MNSRTKNTLPLVLLCLFFVTIFSSCATTSSNFSRSGNVKIEILPSLDPNVEIKQAYAFQEGAELVVTGDVLKKDATYCTYKGQIDIAVIAPDGETLATSKVDYVHRPSRWRDSSFEKRFGITAKPGTQIRLIFHHLGRTASDHASVLGMLLKNERTGQS